MSDTDIILRLLGRDAALPSSQGAPVGALQPLFELLPRNLSPYLTRALERSLRPDQIAPPDRAFLARIRQAGIASALARHATLRTVLGAMSASGIAAVALKGAALAHLVYPDPALRPMVDLDLWVNPDQLDRAARALIGAGYRYPDRKYRGQSELGVQERALELPGTPILVELQSAPSSLKALGPAFATRCWDRSVTTSLGGVPARVLHPEDLIIHVSLHAVDHHRFDTGLLPLLDLRLSIERWATEWDWLAMARDYVNLGIAARMYLMLDLARDLLGAPVPDAFFAALPAPAQLDELKSLAIEQLWAVDHHLPRALERGLGGTTPRSRARWLWQRFTAHYAQDLPATSRGPMAAAREVGRRVLHDFSVKVPRYLRGWIRGDFRGAELKRRAALARGRERLAELLDRMESGINQR